MLKILNEGFDKKYKDNSVSKKNKKKIVEAIERPEEFAEFDDDMNPVNYGIEEDLFDVLDDTAKGISDNINTITGKDSVLRDKNLGKNLTDIGDTVTEIKTGGMFKEGIEDNLGVFHNDNGNDYKVIERSKSGYNALLQRGNQWVIAWNCPENNQGSWGQGHYFFDEETARKAWEEKYVNESLNESDEDRNIKIPKPFNRYFIIDNSGLDSTDIQPGEQIDGYDCKLVAYLYPKEKYEDKLDIYPILTDDPDYPVVDLVGGRLYPVDYITLYDKIYESLKEAKTMFRPKEMRDWLHNNAQFAKEIETYYGKPVDDLFKDDIWNWLSDNKKPYRKFIKDFGLDESLKEDLASYIQKIHDTDEYLWNLHDTDYSWLYDECAKYSDTWGSEESEDSIADCIRKMPKEKQYEILDKLVAPYNESLTEGVVKGNKPMKIIKVDYNQKLKESIKKIISKLNEAEMSPEDKRDTEILRNIYKKIDGRKIGKNTFTPEEQEVIDKYGLDVWGYRGDSKVVTNTGRKNVVNSSEYKSSWGRPQQKFDKINYADRARKIDDRDYAQQINRRKGWNQTFDDAEKEMQGWKQSERINQMKRALHDRKYYQKEIDNAENDLTNRLNRAESDADKKIADANKRMRDETSWARASRDTAQKSINDILDKHRVKECMNQLKEATSPEDKRESDILRNIYYKIQNRSNAKLTPEEQEVVDKYNLVRTYDRNLKANDTNDYLFRRGEGESRSTWGSTTPNRKINYADRARKLGTRDYAKDINNMNSWDSGKTFRDKERTRINNELSKDVLDMKQALSDRRYNDKRIVNAEKDYQNAVAKIEAEKELAKERAKKYSSDNLERSRQKVADANTNIKKLLNKEESLKEDASEKRIVSTGLSGIKNEEILDSVIGQMSDGIWENSPGMEGYWMPVNIDNCDILVDNNQFIKYGTDRYGASKYIDNKYYRKSDGEVRRFFANKIKQITQEYLNDNNLNPYSDWRPDNDEVCDYLDRGSGVTVGDAYKAYKALK